MKLFFFLFIVVGVLGSSLSAMPSEIERNQESKPAQEHFGCDSQRRDDAGSTEEDASSEEEGRAASASRLMMREPENAASEKGEPTHSAPDDLIEQLAQIENRLSLTGAEATTTMSQFDLEMLSKKKSDLEQAHQWTLRALEYCNADSQLSEYYQLGAEFLLAKIEALEKKEGAKVMKSCEEAMEAAQGAIQYHEGNKKLAGAFKDLAILVGTSFQKSELAQPSTALFKKDIDVEERAEKERSPFKNLQAAREHLNYVGSLQAMNPEKKREHLTLASYRMLAAKAMIDWEKDRRNAEGNRAWYNDLMHCYQKTVGFLEAAITKEAEQVKLQEDRQARDHGLSQLVKCHYAMSLSYLRSIEVLKEEQDLKRKQRFLIKYKKASELFKSALFTTINGMSVESEISHQQAQQSALGPAQLEQLNVAATRLRDLQLEQGKKIYNTGMEMLQEIKNSFDEGKVSNSKL